MHSEGTTVQGPVIAKGLKEEQSASTKEEDQWQDNTVINVTLVFYNLQNSFNAWLKQNITL